MKETLDAPHCKDNCGYQTCRSTRQASRQNHNQGKSTRYRQACSQTGGQGCPGHSRQGQKAQDGSGQLYLSQSGICCLDALKLRAAKLGRPVKKTELLRAGVKAIAAMQDTALLAVLQAVPSLKTGRPAKT
jgi:hypothetical protein